MLKRNVPAGIEKIELELLQYFRKALDYGRPIFRDSEHCGCVPMGIGNMQHFEDHIQHLIDELVVEAKKHGTQGDPVQSPGPTAEGPATDHAPRGGAILERRPQSASE